MWMRMSMRSPLNPWETLAPCSAMSAPSALQVNGAPGGGESREHAHQGDPDTQHDVQPGSIVLSVAQQRERFIAERRERGVPAAESRRQQQAQLRPYRRRPREVGDEEPE